VINAIYGRMQAAYTAQTRQVRAESTAEGERLRAEAERNRAEILATANRDAQRLFPHRRNFLRIPCQGIQ